ncbi:MAG TPA: MOSC domain-containing protein [Dehalococcoidia bacterium]|nr:MOSC domain-containing protein [Dehalococcoidia bacterium]
MSITVARLYRYPVKSMLGEDLDAIAIDARGVVGDRAYAVIDPAENRVGSAKIPHKWKRLYEFSAMYPPGEDTALPPPLILFPGGTPATATDADLEARLSEALGKPVRFVSVKPEDLKLEAVKPGLDAVDLEETVDFPLVNPFFDFAALHLVTTATLAHLRTLYPAGDYDPRRFRPNLVLDAPGETGFLEETWLGKTPAIGPEVRLRIFMRTHRCAATTLPHHGLPNDPEILRTANRHNSGNVGVYAAVEQPGMLRVGDVVAIT